eukprot:TRINITY_DN9708_c0_g2_i2.p2 TRINITY_DN9708_c0_g2~~TRINITY_DN9708_c0_g2_i2.p2  ORF type:complete len:176 (+),score=17.50 TRINITY_DN9708_c0_g2_i2:1803-2330(+)
MLKSWLADQGFKDATACLDNLHAGISSLHVAAQLADVDVCFELSNRYPLLIHARDSNSQTPLHYLCAGSLRQKADSSIACAKLLIERNADVNAVDKYQRTPLHLLAAYHPHPSSRLCKVLLQSQANPNLTQLDNRTAMQVAMGSNSPCAKYVIQALIEHYAKRRRRVCGGVNLIS